ncbi:ribosomal protein S18 acetylase RimI-like enzyme [Kitasatospora gansuensis]|uniref:Ribosomal protein S18 acetylase RimI-like enzyme n=1 Tax=Kitasatospora gansuensis TaxID=258050 RepID=A0A7W7WJY7_9ACTN|nr:GNAT family N-acetyltransferase [Kitasatospora gansuensis]MBB4950262.1 ribosomal protein S18 acetylase RimI-like enzyme [Kitasatospora gansuensis]
MTDLLDRLERYYDAVPRNAARAEDFGPLSLFVREGEGWPYYARPALGWTGPAATVADVDRVRARQRELGVPESFEWVAETTPALRAAVEGSGLAVHDHPLMVLDPAAPPMAAPATAARVVGADDPALAEALAVAYLSFSEPGTAIGTAGPDELAAFTAKLTADGTAARIAGRIRDGLTVVAAAFGPDGTALCGGQHQPVGPVSELVGIGTLPSARRQGLGYAVTAALVADARARGVETVFLSAGDQDVARIYGRVGFRTVGTALIAEPAE